jgi:phosphomethylpyrimidine synthase
MFLPVDKSITVSPPQRIAQVIFSTSSRIDEPSAELPMLALILVRKLRPMISRPDLRVPMREIAQADTPTAFGGERNPPIFVYDCSGPYGDPQAAIDIRQGLSALRVGWIAERGNTEELPHPTSAYGRERMRKAAADPSLDALRFPGLHRKGAVLGGRDRLADPLGARLQRFRAYA